MSVYMTEREQLDAIKKWWQRHSNLITVVASVILLAVAGYKYWNYHQIKITQQASNTYEHMMVAFSNQDNKGVRAYASQLLKEYDDTIYADAARLTLAKLLVTRAKYSQAQEQLEHVVTHSSMPAFKQIAKIRMARLLIAAKSYDQALAELSQVSDAAYISVINEIKGDIYVATGQFPRAIASYREAIAEVQNKGMGNLFLEMKTNELAALTQSMNRDTAVPKAA